MAETEALRRGRTPSLFRPHRSFTRLVSSAPAVTELEARLREARESASAKSRDRVCPASAHHALPPPLPCPAPEQFSPSRRRTLSCERRVRRGELAAPLALSYVVPVHGFAPPPHPAPLSREDWCRV